MSAAELYETDFYAWARVQAAALRRWATVSPDPAVDWPRLIEEVEGLGTAVRDELRGDLREVLTHLLLLGASGRSEPRAGRMDAIDATRDRIADRITTTLRDDLAAELPTLFARAHRAAKDKLERYGEADAAARLPVTCPWSLEQLLDVGWWPR